MKICTNCGEEIKEEAERCPFCGEFSDIKELTKIQKDLEKKWLKTWLISSVVIFLPIIVLFFIEGDFVNSNGENSSILEILIFLFPAIIIGGIFTFIRHFKNFREASQSKIPKTTKDRRKANKTLLFYTIFVIITLVINDGGFKDDYTIIGALKNSFVLLLWIICTWNVITIIMELTQKDEK